MTEFRVIGQVVEFDRQPVAVIRDGLSATMLGRVVAALDGLPEDWWVAEPPPDEVNAGSHNVD